MSRIVDLGKNLEKLPIILAEYDEHLLNAPERLSIKGKMMEEALKEQAAWPIFYDEKRKELRTLTKFIEMKVGVVRSKHLRNYTENYSRELSDRVKEKYIDKEDDYLAMQELYLEIDELYEKYDAVVNAFTTRGFALRDIVVARSNSFHDALL